MRSRPLVIAVAALLSTSAWGQQKELPLATDALLHSARAWEARDRGDLARLALEKLVAARPNSPEALMALGELQLRMGDFASAERTLRLMRTRFPETQLTQAFDAAHRFATRDRIKLASVQRLVQIKRYVEAKEAMKDLFPAGPPGGTLGLEYYRLLASMPSEWNTARAGFERLASAHPGDPRYQLALARHLSEREATAASAANIAEQLLAREDVKQAEVNDVLRRAIHRADGHVSQSSLHAYIQRYPDDRDIATAAQRQQYATEQKSLSQTNALAHVSPELQQAHVSELAQALNRSTDAGARLTADLLQSLLGERLTAANSDQDIAARQLTLQAQDALTAHHLDLASIRLEAALALMDERAEDLIALAERVEDSHPTTASELLLIAKSADPSSDWIFETYVRSLISRGEISRALDELASRPVTGSWSQASKDDLIASALDARARTDLEHGDLVRPRRDLERAVALAPTNVWARYRLAMLLEQVGDRNTATETIRAGLQLDSSPEMRYAGALYYSSIGEPNAALDLLDSVPSQARTDGMLNLHLMTHVAVARREAELLLRQNDAAGAVARLETFERSVTMDLDATRDLAYAFLAIREPHRAQRAVEAFSPTTDEHRTRHLLLRADVQSATDDKVGLQHTLVVLRSRSLKPEQLARTAELQRELDLSSVRALERVGRYAEARRAINQLLHAMPDDERVRRAAAQLELSAGQPQAAIDLYATLVAEDADDLDLRLDYVRALTDAGEISLARHQLQAISERAPKDDVELQMNIARQQLAIGDYKGATLTYGALLAQSGELARQAEVIEAQRQIDLRTSSWVESGFESTHKPGDSGISSYDATTLTNTWHHAIGFDRALSVHADLTSIDTGTLTRDIEDAGLLGSLAVANERRHANSAQDGVAPGLRYLSEDFAVDIGSTPLGFLLTNVVGGVEWTRKWRSLNSEVGVERRAVTSSVLSYAGMKDPATGKVWGGVIETGPYVSVARYEANYSLAASLRYSCLSGEHVADNNFFGARVAGNRQVLDTTHFDAFVGAAANYWAYEHNLQNYTLGSGGYYSPQSYLSFAVPMEVEGEYAGFSFRVRATFSHSRSKVGRAPFYPMDPSLMSAAVTLPPGYDAPYFEADRGSGFSVAAYAAVERELLPNWILGAKLDLDRADYYEPTTFMLYLRRGLGRVATRIEVPPRPPRAYN